LKGAFCSRLHGDAGKSIYGEKFADEDLKAYKHTGKGVLSMANAGPNTNGSQFFLCFVKTAWLDGKHVVFGRVVQGGELLDVLNDEIGSESGRPNKPVVIADCGQL
ncbi:cyclophilin-like domain-containing protein, partial [Thamnocephalis sphaerospora]